jgi:hypothetical protein
MTEPNKNVDIEGRKKRFTDIDRMVDDGLSGGYVTEKDENALMVEATSQVKESEPTINGKTDERKV